MKTQEIPSGNSFATTLGDLRRGRAVSELSDHLVALVAKVRETGKKGSINLKLTVEPADNETVNITDDVSIKLPLPNKGRTIFFVTDANVLTRKDPRQSEMDFADEQEEAPATSAAS